MRTNNNRKNDMSSRGGGASNISQTLNASRNDNSSQINNSSYIQNQYSQGDITMYKEFLGKVNKLSNKGWSYNLRLLKMDSFALTYYKNVPSDYDERTMKSQQFEDGKVKVKQSIPIKRILAIDEIKEDDKKKYKKLGKAPDIAFKVVFPKKYMIKGREYNPEEDDGENDSDEEDEDNGDGDSGDERETRTKMKKSKSQIRSKSKGKGAGSKAQNLTTWYFVCDSKYHQKLWMERLISQSRAQNSLFVVDDSVVRGITETNNANNSGNQKQKLYNQEDSEDGSYNEDEHDFLPSKVNKKQQKQPVSSKQTKLEEKKGNNAFGNQQKPQQVSKNPKTESALDKLVNNKNKNNQATNYNDQLMGRSDSDFPDLDQVIYQNLLINNVKIDGDGNIDQNVQKQNEDSDGEQFIEDSQDAKERLRKLNENVNNYFKQTTDLQSKKSKKEEKGWDLKFQNYWGYLISADKNLKDSMTLSERFFDHVGKFRRTSQQLVKEIIDELHIPTTHNMNYIFNFQWEQQKVQDENFFLQYNQKLKIILKNQFTFKKLTLTLISQVD